MQITMWKLSEEYTEYIFPILFSRSVKLQMQNATIMKFPWVCGTDRNPLSSSGLDFQRYQILSVTSVISWSCGCWSSSLSKSWIMDFKTLLKYFVLNLLCIYGSAVAFSPMSYLPQGWIDGKVIFERKNNNDHVVKKTVQIVLVHLRGFFVLYPTTFTYPPWSAGLVVCTYILWSCFFCPQT